MAFFPLWMKCPIQIFSAQQVICLPDCKHSPCQLFRQNWQIWSPNTWHLDFPFFAKKISYSGENKRSGFGAEWKGTSLWGCHILGRVHKNKFYGILTSCRGRRGQREGIHPICRSSHTLVEPLWRWTALAHFLKAEASNKTEEDNLQFWRSGFRMLGMFSDFSSFCSELKQEAISFQ